MIKANEIRLGNIYNRKHGKGWTETIITEEILGKIFTNSNEFALDDFEAIALTRERLFACGFKLPYNQARYLIANDFYGELETNENAFDLKDYEGNLVAQIRYLHQFQNLYFRFNRY